MSSYNTLIISPHCDDEVLGCGGIINNRKPYTTFVYYMGIDEFHIVTKKDRIHEVDEVSSYLSFNYEIANNIVNNYNIPELIEQITCIINKIKPIELFMPFISYNQDHTAVNSACMVALRPHDKNHFVKKVFIYEVDQYQTWTNHEFNPNYFEEIDLEKKVSAYLLHKSQIRNMRPPELIEKYAYIRGISSGLKYAEGFVVKRLVHI
jgi:N-acetylglucosamine malate deacetylase 1